MNVHYKCRCMPNEGTVMVPDRPPGGDIVVWMEMVQGCLGYDHAARSPTCRATQMEYAKIPIDENAEGIGQKPTLSS